MKLRTLALLLALSFASVGASGSEIPFYLYVQSGHSGAQTQVDVNHSTVWSFTPNVDFILGGGMLVMKDGPKTSGDIGLTLSLGGSAEIVLTNSAFTQSWTETSFSFPTSVLLQAGKVYSLTVHSLVPDEQTKAYFIKGDVTQFGFKDATGQVLSPGSFTVVTDPPPPPPPGAVPEPAALMLCAGGLMLVSLIVLARRRRAVAEEPAPRG